MLLVILLRKELVHFIKHMASQWKNMQKTEGTTQGINQEIKASKWAMTPSVPKYNFQRG